MLTTEDLYIQDTMPTWSDISLMLYKEFTINCLLPKTFRYYLENDVVIDVVFKEWAMKHLWAIHHIDTKIDKHDLFSKIDEGLSFGDFTTTVAMRKRLNDCKDRLRMFACIYHILETGNIFYIEGGKLQKSDIRVDYLKSKLIGNKGVNVGMRLEEDVYVPLTMLIDRAINPLKTVEGLQALKVDKLEIFESQKIVKVIT
ncbi:MAG: hypothetical protein E6357_21160 [Clostridiales bacterium]|nr:hypothetical protein [Clostridiales bacterium]